jgi:hypothetical protein
MVAEPLMDRDRHGVQGSVKDRGDDGAAREPVLGERRDADMVGQLLGRSLADPLDENVRCRSR